MTTKAYWPQRVENVQMDMRDTDGRPDTSGSWLSDDEDGESMKKTFKNGKVQVRSTDVEKNHSADSKTGGDEVVGSTSLYDENGKIRLVPTPTPDPKDPLNLPNWRKWVAIGSMCLFGALSLSAEVAIAGLLPVFLLEYSGVDPTKVLKDPNFKSDPANPLSIVPEGVTPFPLYFLIPLSIAIGRRPVLIFTATCSWAGGFWAGSSTSLQAHIAARILHGLGSGAVEALLPLIVQDMVFLHQRNRAMSAVIASQGPLIVLVGTLAPYISANSTWRWIYWSTSILGVVAWIMLIVFVPETRKTRSARELAGEKIYPISEGADRTELDYATYGQRTMKDNVGFFTLGFQWLEAGKQLIDTLKTTMFPAVIFGTLVNSAFSINPFRVDGTCRHPSIFATVIVYFFGGPLADKLSIKMSQVLGKGKREPEYSLPNLILPFVLGIAGCFLFGVAAQNNLHFSVLLLGSFFILSGALTSLTLVNSFVIESYPQWAGPVLTNVSSLRIFVSFFFSSQVTTWIEQNGNLAVFAGGFATMLLVVSLGIPAIFFTGKRLRGWTSGGIAKKQ
ncbi:major facilitator superfamily transporter [Apiospora kogelbergensis]|uniref:major facilitator superfamily transporter n=1 Tax=Apiospora kogelbergensis TaxID=1337665 RepID=UPI0031315DA1